jgi:hypothetical protein
VLLKASSSYVKPLTPALSPLLRRRERESIVKAEAEYAAGHEQQKTRIDESIRVEFVF